MLLALFLLGPEIDNVLGIQSGRDLRYIQNLRPGSGRLEDQIKQSFRIEYWNAYHVDEIYRTVVDCHVVASSGRREVLSWEIAHWFSPNSRVPKRRLFICALTPEAAKLTPEFVPPGLSLKEYPSQRVLRSEFLYGWASKNWIGGDPVKLIQQ
jgi:hypothetical protein